MPAVLSRTEVQSLLGYLPGIYRLMAEFIYGAGLRLLELHRLRVGDLDFEHRRVLVYDGKGRKDRYTLLPELLVRPLRAQIEKVVLWHKSDLGRGLGEVVLPRAYDRKNGGASRTLRWQFLFPSEKTFYDPRTGKSGRWHLNPGNLQNAVRTAVRQAGIQKRATVHTLRHSFATHILQDGCDVRTLQALLGHSHVNTTMVYLHVLENWNIKTPSPLDRLERVVAIDARA